eukprot:CAMPEP_0168373078 /NCGR_PEP_ID=MMETSP0228-20121227/8606_1 /TAXON_ID=133427 /ORGANISM="Protoceratium reticulatum, Strain CCCM 535 (=CCMP 1889)" /LENGTH=151 /DNA_ID=CAMNT_0008385995 /DNA_START=66 /DNA_END=521 /DNA_ORIENTATION=-
MAHLGAAATAQRADAQFTNCEEPDAEPEPCGELSAALAARKAAAALGDISDAETASTADASDGSPTGVATTDRDCDVAAVSTLGAWQTSCSEEEERINVHAWRSVGAGVLRCFEDLSDDEDESINVNAWRTVGTRMLDCLQKAMDEEDGEM